MSNNTSGKYSLRRRISSTYISVYVGICVLMILSFITGCGLYVRDKYSGISERIADEISFRLYAEGVEDEEEFREFLYEKCLFHGPEEIFLYNMDDELLVATNYTYDNEKYFTASENSVINKFLPGFSDISDGIYISEHHRNVVSEENEYEVKVIVYHSIKDELDIFKFIISLSAGLLMIGMVLFIVLGISRTHKMLAPIAEMTEIAKKINGENMDIRFDNTGAKFELSELADTINSMMDDISASYDKQKRFVSDVSHELRTPISVISGYANMLNRWGKDDEEILKEGIENIIQEADTMSELVQTLLFLARHDNETLKYEPADTDVSSMLEDIIKDASRAAADVKFSSDIVKGLSAYIDEARIRQAVRVFIDNAVKYSDKDEKKVTVSLKRYEDHYEIGIKDNGIGISGEDMPHVFERFYRADESRTKDTGGYGLGLSIARVIVSAHGGKIKLRSKVKEGSEFIIILPFMYEQLTKTT